MEASAAIARKTLAEIAACFPNLRMVEEQNPNVEIAIVVPVQPGLKQQVWLCLQNGDELSLSVGHLHVEWFPCTSSARASAYFEAVTGFLSGRYRILEHYRNEKCFKAQLQAPGNGAWHTVATWQKVRLPSLRRSSVREIRNA
jgi:hypothetical protein